MKDRIKKVANAFIMDACGFHVLLTLEKHLLNGDQRATISLKFGCAAL